MRLDNFSTVQTSSAFHDQMSTLMAHRSAFLQACNKPTSRLAHHLTDQEVSRENRTD